jgi:cytochrome P450 family 110
MKVINGPKTPIFFQRVQWILDPVNYMEKSSDRDRDLFMARVVGFGDNVVFVSHPQGIQQILTSDRKQFSSPGKKTNGILQPLIGEYSVNMLEGEPHKQRRQLIVPPFHGERLQAYGKLICNLVEKVMSQLPQEQPFLARHAMQSISLQVILEAVFGLSEGERYQKLKDLLGSMTDLFNSPLKSAFLFFPSLQKDLGPWSPWGNFVRQRQQIDKLLYTEIAERRANPNPDSTDILSLLMSARDEEGNGMSDKELRDELMTLLFAGHETTATAMAWSLYWTHRLSEVREKILAELASLGDSPNPMEIARLPYLTAVCQETLRIHPVAMLTFPRVVQEPVELLGYQLQPGNIVMGCIYLTHQREDIYRDRKQFKPERFLERQFSPYEFFPFGGGVRRCVGDALALLEMKLVLATILSRYKLTLTETQPEIPQRRGVTLAPARGVKMKILGIREKTIENSLQVTGIGGV